MNDSSLQHNMSGPEPPLTSADEAGHPPAPHDTEKQVQLLLALTQAINQVSDFEAALNVVLNQICRFTNWSLGLAWCPSADGDFLECTCVCKHSGEDLNAFFEASRNRRWHKGDALPGMVWESKKSHWVPDFAADPRLQRASVALQLGLKAGMAIPVIADDKVVAVLEFLIAAPRNDDERLRGVVSATAETLGSLFLRKRMEAALRDSEKRYRTLIETANDVIFSLTPDGRFSSANRAFETVTGWGRSDWMGEHFAPILHPDDVSSALKRLQSALEGELYPMSEYRVRKADGSYIVGEITLVPELRDGTVTGFFGIGRDITARKRAEQAVLQSEEHYREISHHAFQMQEQLRRLSDRILRIQEQERTRISRDLHDEIGQALTAINVSMAVIEKDLASSPPGLTERIADVRQILEQTMETVHRFSCELRPAMLDDLGLLPALRAYIKDFARHTGLPVRLYAEHEENLGSLDSECKTVIYRVVQEALNNTAKHANARKVSVEVTGMPRHVCLEVRDNGKGFATEDGRTAAEAPGRLGLLGIAERVRLVNGNFEVDSQVGRGTTLRAVIPFNTAPSPDSNEPAENR